MATASVVVRVRELLAARGSVVATVTAALAQQELQRRGCAIGEPDGALCVICQEAVTAYSELACLSCTCESLYHWACLMHPQLAAGAGLDGPIKCPTCRTAAYRRRLSIELLELSRRRRRRWSDVALPALADLELEEQQVLKDGEESRPHQELYRLRASWYKRQRACGEGSSSSADVDALMAALPQLTASQLQALATGGRGRSCVAGQDAPLLAVARPGGFCCGLCVGPLSTFSEFWSQGCLRCCSDSALQVFYHRDCLGAATLRPCACLACGAGAIEQRAFNVKQRLQELTEDLHRPVAVPEVVQRARAMCRAVADERAELELRCRSLERASSFEPTAPDGRRPRSRSLRRLVMSPLRP